MGTVNPRCGKCVWYSRKHIGGLPSYGFCCLEPFSQPVHFSMKGCGYWIDEQGRAELRRSIDACLSTVPSTDQPPR